jgi:uncharacterized protein
MSTRIAEPLLEPDLAPAPPPAPTANPLAGNPGMVGIPTVIAGAIGLGLVNTGYVPATATGAAVPIIMSATAIGLLIATIWAAALGQNASATLFAVFFGFYGSYAVLAIGLTHNWFGVPADQAVKTQELWLICWLGTIGLLTLTTMRLPWSFTLLLGLVDVALVFLLLGTANADPTWTHLGGAVVWAFIAVAVYLFVDLMEAETGGRGLPLGRPIVT